MTVLASGCRQTRALLHLEVECFSVVSYQLMGRKDSHRAIEDEKGRIEVERIAARLVKASAERRTNIVDIVCAVTVEQLL